MVRCFHQGGGTYEQGFWHDYGAFGSDNCFLRERYGDEQGKERLRTGE